MYVLHYAPDNASLIVRLALEEAGLPYRSALVDRAARAQDSAAYRALNPTGLIPTLATPQGPISETAAILLWLSEAHPEAGLAPRPGSPLRLPPTPTCVRFSIRQNMSHRTLFLAMRRWPMPECGSTLAFSTRQRQRHRRCLPRQPCWGRIARY